MLNAVLKGKRLGSGIDGTGQITGMPATGAEDILSAIFFSRLAYLPVGNVSRFFSLILSEEQVVDGIEELDFWPSWKITDSRIEPDVIMVSGESLIIIEAKRCDNMNMQSSAQLAREIVASDSSGFTFSKIILLTVGGMASCSISAANLLAQNINEELLLYPERDSNVTDNFLLICQTWKSLYYALRTSLTDQYGNVPLHHSRLLNDIYRTLIWHDIHLMEFTGLGNLPAPQVSKVIFPSSFTNLSSDEIRMTDTGKHHGLLQDFSKINITLTPHRDRIPQLFSGIYNG